MIIIMMAIKIRMIVVMMRPVKYDAHTVHLESRHCRQCILHICLY